MFFSEQTFYGNYSKLDSQTNTVISPRLPTRQDGVENRDKVVKVFENGVTALSIFNYTFTWLVRFVHSSTRTFLSVGQILSI